MQCLNSHDVQMELFFTIDLIEENVTEALYKFNDILRKSAECMKQRICVSKGHNRNSWFDEECKSARRDVRKLLRIFKKTSGTTDRNNFCIARREYKNLLLRKRKMFNDLLFKRITDSVNDQQEFWKAWRTVSKRRLQCQNNINIQEWHEHF